MVIERFRNGDYHAVGARFRARGRMMPDGVRYLDSWITPDGTVCYQVMEAERRDLLDQWIAAWSDLVDFEIVEIERTGEFWARVGD